MIRNTDEYMMPDGSPRYGVRFGNGLVDGAEPEPMSEPVAPGDLAERAASFTAHQLSIAGKLRFTVRNSAEAEKALRDLRVSHPAEYAEADRAVTEHLGSAAAWRRKANNAAAETVITSELVRGLTGSTVGALFARLGFSAIPLLVFVAATHVETNFWLTMVIFLAVSFAIERIQGHVRRRSIGADGADVSIAAASVLWDDVVDATFINILEARGIAVYPASQRAATAGWVHLARTADSVQQLIAGK